MAKFHKLCDFVKSEILFFEENCNFTDSELQFFNLKSKGKSNIEISFAMNISERTVSNLSKSVNKKIIKVL